jgi:hypothetical protein
MATKVLFQGITGFKVITILTKVGGMPVSATTLLPKTNSLDIRG